MQTASATLSSYRQAPRKVRLLAGLIRGKKISVALVELGARSKRAAPIMEKLLRSAIANAKVQGMDENTLIVKEVRVDQGAILKRSMPRAFGRAFPIHKHTSHVTITLGSDLAPVKAASPKTDASAEVAAAKKTKKTA